MKEKDFKVMVFAPPLFLHLASTLKSRKKDRYVVTFCLNN